MRDFARLENSKMNLKSDDEFSASACQKIHSELLASVNEIYKNLKTKPLLKRNAISTSSLTVQLSRAQRHFVKRTPFSTAALQTALETEKPLGTALTRLVSNLIATA